MSCQGSVPEAIIAFLEGENFEDVIRTAISLGGDSDTIGAMAGSVAEAFYGVPDDLKKKCLEILPKDLRECLKMFAEDYQNAKSEEIDREAFEKWFQEHVEGKAKRHFLS